MAKINFQITSLLLFKLSKNGQKQHEVTNYYSNGPLQGPVKVTKLICK